MPDKSGPDDKKTEPRRFISEKIVKQPRTKREIMRRAVALLLTAALLESSRQLLLLFPDRWRKNTLEKKLQGRLLR